MQPLTLFALLAVSAQNPSYLLSDFESQRDGWAEQAQIVPHPSGSGHVLQWSATGGGPAFLFFRFAESHDVELSDWDRLTFEYCLDEPVDWWGLKMVDYPLADGYEATWQVGDQGSVSQGHWQQAEIVLKRPQWRWGNAPNEAERYVVLRMQHKRDKPVTVLVDNLVLHRAPFSLSMLSVGERQVEGDELHSNAMLSFTNRTDRRLPVRLRAEPSAEWLHVSLDKRIVLPPRQTAKVRMGLWADLKETVPLAVGIARIQAQTRGGTMEEKELELPVPFETPEHPMLVMNPAIRETVRKRIATEGIFKEVWDGIQKNADQLLDKVIEYPDRGGQWWHWYSCKKCGTRLRTESATRHVCPSCGEVYTGWPYDDVVLDRIHQGLAKDSRTLGIAYQVTGDEKYAAKAIEILKGYADRYLDYPLHNIHGKPEKGGGRVSPQTLDEAVWLIKIAQGYDGVWDAMSQSDRETIGDKLLLPAAELIKDHQWGIHNICCWHAAAYGLVGLTLGREDLASAAIHGPKGFVRQVEEGVKEDGLWYEGSWGYHFYTMLALEPLAIAAHNVGIDLYSDRYKGMYSLPLLYMAPDGQLPAFNDSGRARILTAGFAPKYEIAYARWQDPLFGQIVSLGQRKNESALLYGADNVSEELPALKSRIFHSAGTAILRSGNGENYLALDFGEHGGGHGHPDKLNFVLWGKKTLLAEDPGSIAYGNPAHAGFYKQTVSHNTILVDGKSQSPATGELECSAFDESGGLVVATAGKAYAGVTIRRAMALVGDLVLDMVHCSSDEPHQYDWLFHCRGEMSCAADFQPAKSSPEGQGLEWIDAWRSIQSPGPWTATWRESPEVGLTVSQSTGPSTLFAGIGRGNPPTVRPPLVMSRQTGKEALFLTAMGILGDEDAALQVESPEVAGAMTVAATFHGQRVLLVLCPEDVRTNCEGVKLRGRGSALIIESSDGTRKTMASDSLRISSPG